MSYKSPSSVEYEAAALVAFLREKDFYFLKRFARNLSENPNLLALINLAVRQEKEKKGKK